MGGSVVSSAKRSKPKFVDRRSPRLIVIVFRSRRDSSAPQSGTQKNGRKKMPDCYGRNDSSGAPPPEDYPRTRTALKLRMTWPPAVGRPKLIIGRKRENISIWSS
jgi:hypothetical protein